MESTYATAKLSKRASAPAGAIEAEVDQADVEGKLLDELVGVFEQRLASIVGPPVAQEGHTLNPVESERSVLASRLAGHNLRLRTVRESLTALLARIEL